MKKLVLLTLFLSLWSCSGGSIPDPTIASYHASDSVLVDGSGGIAGEPFIVRDDTLSKWRMFFHRSKDGIETIHSTTSENLSGPWADEITFPNLIGYHKFALLVDEHGEPAKIDGQYYGYFVGFTETIDWIPVNKKIYVSSAPELSGPWSVPQEALFPGEHDGPDGCNVDAPYAMFYKGKVHLWYMGHPWIEEKTYGLAQRLLLAHSENPQGPFEKKGAVLNPSQQEGDWDYGWIGGPQVRMANDGSFWMAYNAGTTRTFRIGEEPPRSSWGFAVSKTIDGPWEKLSRNPVEQASEETVNIWRPHLTFDPESNTWITFYNAGPTGHEDVTFAISESQ